MIPTSHAIEVCAAAICGTDDAGNLPPNAVRYVTERLRRGEFRGFKVQRRWRMTDDDIAAAIESLRPSAVRQRSAFDTAVATIADRAADRPLLSSMTATSRRRMAVTR